jgi:putative DNA primase/helicase
MSFYITYIKTKNKKPIEKFKGKNNINTYEAVQSLPEFAGKIAPDSILVDVDDMEQSELLLKICEEENIRCSLCSKH